MKRGAWVLLALLSFGCKPNLNRMLVQHRIDPYADDPIRLELISASPPQGTVTRQAIIGQPELTKGCSLAGYVQQLPITVSGSVTQLGHERFTTFCAACHGVDGTATTPVAQAMEKTKPKSLVVPPARDDPPGRVYRQVMLGYQMMPSYRNELNVHERWATVAYLQVLQKQAAGSATGTSSPATAGPVCTGEEP